MIVPRLAREWILLFLGFTLLILSQTRWGIGVFAWIAPAPLLAALRLRRDRRFLLAFAGLTLLAWTLATMKIITWPVPPALALLFGVVLAVVHAPAYLLWGRLVRRGRDGLAIVAFAAASSLAEWAQAELTPFGVWGSAPSTQVGALAVIQLLSLVGSPGLSFLMHTVAAALEAAWARRLARPAAAALGGAVVVALAWGAVRADLPVAGPEVRAAAIRTDAAFVGLPIPSAEERRAIDEALFQRTAQAAAAGAELVVWNEAATLVPPEEEGAFVARLEAAARQSRIELVAAYIVPVSIEPFRFENKLRWMGPDGAERLTYHKRYPAPGEAAAPGPGLAPALATTIGGATAAICYDYDFPSLARAHARSGAGVVALPSSDWRGIDPIHTEMAAMRAVESGLSVVRSTRFGLSAGIDARGRLLGHMSANESLAPFLLVSVPASPVPTLYAALGNTVLLPLGGLLVWAIGAATRRARRVEAGAAGVGVVAAA
jgi:apolipoprotein N-acyltransferase